MPISGFETWPQVQGTLAALHAEIPRNEQHALAIAKQIEIFQAESDRFEKEETERLEREHKARLAAAKRGAGVPR